MPYACAEGKNTHSDNFRFLFLLKQHEFSRWERHYHLYKPSGNGGNRSAFVFRPENIFENFIPLGGLYG